MSRSNIKKLVLEEMKKHLVPVHHFWDAKGGSHIYLTNPKEIQKQEEEYGGKWIHMGVCFYAIMKEEEDEN